MAGGKEKMGGNWGKSGEKRREEALDSPTGRTHARLFACAGAPGAPQGAGFCLGPPAPVSARAGEKRASGGVTGPFFWRRRGKNAWEGLLGVRLEML